MGGQYVIYNTAAGWKVRLVDSADNILLVADQRFKSSEEVKAYVKRVKKASLFAKTRLGKMNRVKVNEIQQ